MAMQTDKYKTAHSLDPQAEGKQNLSFGSWQRKLYFEEKVHVVLKTHITWPSLESAEMNSAYRKTQTAHGRKRKGVQEKQWKFSKHSYYLKASVSKPLSLQTIQEMLRCKIT